MPQIDSRTASRLRYRLPAAGSSARGPADPAAFRIDSKAFGGRVSGAARRRRKPINREELHTPGSLTGGQDEGLFEAPRAVILPPAQMRRSFAGGTPSAPFLFSNAFRTFSEADSRAR